MRIIILIFLFILGAAMGSFACCQARRLRLKDKKKKTLGNRSVCMHCGYQLTILDNIPIVSWLCLRGRCRKCHKKIGVLEFLAEVCTGIAFLLVGISVSDFGAFSGIEWAIFGVNLCFLTVLAFLAIYDGMWGELPQVGLTFSVICGIIILILRQIDLWVRFQNIEMMGESLLSAVCAVGILAGVYFLLYFCSKGKLVGNGDWVLGLAIALALGDWWLALLVIFFSNILATFAMMPAYIIKKKRKIYFGPWMVVGYLVVLVGMETFVNFF